MTNNYAQISELNIKMRDNILYNCYFTSPFKVMTPFAADDGFVSVMLLSSSAGIMEGDTQNIAIDIEENSKVEITSQSYEKIHKMKTGCATRETAISVASESELLYTPMPTIPFADSAFANVTTVKLADDASKLMFAEVLVAGRVHYNEVFRYRYYKSRLKIYVAEELIYFDNARFEPQEMAMSGLLLYDGYTHLLHAVMVGYGSKSIVAIREYLSNIAEEVLFGVSQALGDAVVVKVLGYNSQVLMSIIDKLKQLKKGSQ
ncbi:urease accessory protein UreD [Candidatus Epulonipiscium viviparus]|uniref:urease accessory protein UreD n=1 Tax=Candidatus Epulonipiscium viviparus TaxID=420336 RepID=UPI0006898A55|nr:urease accessory protein UreD [Candidatus Epulopiscium viviparus]